MKFSLLAYWIIALVALSADIGEGYRILGVFPGHIRSHFMMFETLMKGLARKGHQVDVASIFPQKKSYPNYTDIIKLPAPSNSIHNNLSFDSMGDVNIVKYAAIEMGLMKCDLLGHPELQRLMRNPPRDPPYDLVITQVLGANCYFALGHKFNVPVVGLASAVLYPWHHRLLANPPNLAFNPNNLIKYTEPMSFWQRFHNLLDHLYQDLYFHHLSRAQDKLIKKYLGEDAQSLEDAERNLALILVNSHPSMNGARPTTPAIVEVGGLHIQDDHAEVPQDLKDWMDSSTQGFIYFSFGSMITIESFPEEQLRAIYRSFGKIAPIRLLIRINKPERLPPGMPDNFRTFQWAPQYRILGHKNVKAFVTHGGLMGTQEAVDRAVPLIGIPFIADQYVNMKRYCKMKIAVKLNAEDLTEETMDRALREILHNPVYKRTMLRVSAAFRERPIRPLEAAIWWVEYAVKYGGDVLRSPALDLPWWQIQLFDVYAFILLILSLPLITIIIVTRLILRKLFKARSNEIFQEKKIN